MRKELEDKIFRRWPDWFRASIDGTRSLMGFGFQCGDGWFDILWRCFEAIEPSVADETKCWHPFEIVEVKEKFGVLRICGSPTIIETLAAIERAEAESLTACELCGRPGHLSYLSRSKKGLSSVRVQWESCSPSTSAIWITI